MAAPANIALPLDIDGRSLVGRETAQAVLALLGIGKTAAPAYGTTVSIDASAGEWQTITVTNGTAFTISAPTNAPSSARTQTLAIEVLNSSGGAMGVITWNGAFIFATGAWTNPANTKRRYVAFRWNGSAWIAGALASADY